MLFQRRNERGNKETVAKYSVKSTMNRIIQTSVGARCHVSIAGANAVVGKTDKRKHRTRINGTDACRLTILFASAGAVISHVDKREKCTRTINARSQRKRTRRCRGKAPPNLMIVLRSKGKTLLVHTFA